MDPSNPDNLFAGLWDFRRKGWTFRSGGDGPDTPSGSGFFRSTDGGKTWTEITPENNKGFPEKTVRADGGGLCAFQSEARLRIVESTESALFVSDDGGATWDRRDKSQLDGLAAVLFRQSDC